MGEKHYLRPWAITTGRLSIPYDFISRTDISSDAKICWATMSRFSGRKTYTTAKVETIGEAMGCSGRSAARYIAELESAGLIETVRRGAGRSAERRFLCDGVTFSSMITSVPDEVGEEDDFNEGKSEEKTDQPKMSGLKEKTKEPQSDETDSDSEQTDSARRPDTLCEGHKRNKEVVLSAVLDSVLDNKTSPLPPSSEETGEDFLPEFVGVYRRAKGTKHPNRTELAVFSEIVNSGHTSGELLGALRCFLADDFWKAKKYPVRALKSQLSKYIQKAEEVGVAEEAEPDASHLIPRPRSAETTRAAEQVSNPPDHPPALPDIALRWNAAVKSGPVVRVWSPNRFEAAALRAAQVNPVFAEMLDELLAKCEAFNAAGNPFALGKLLQEWSAVANGTYDWMLKGKDAKATKSFAQKASDDLFAGTLRRIDEMAARGEIKSGEKS